MCRSKKAATGVIQPTSQIPSSRRPSKEYHQSRRMSLSSSSFDPSTSDNFTTNNTSSDHKYKDSWKSSVSSRTSLSALHDSLPENPHVYNFTEISSATNNFLSNRYSSSSSSSSPAWRCSIHGNDVIIFQRKFRRPIGTSELRERLLVICKSHHSSLVKLRGASISGNYIYLVYDYIHGANLADCLRNPRNQNFTVLSNWMARIQIAADLAHGLDYVHHSTGLGKSFIHNHIKSTSIIITEPSFNAKICHFGTAELCGEIAKEDDSKNSDGSTKKLNFKRSDSRVLKFEGTRGYMSPEFQSLGVATQRSDVYAFGVVILEILSGEEPLKYRFDAKGGGYERVSVIAAAMQAVEGGGNGVRRWVDSRLRDSYPVDVAEKLARVALECVEEDQEKRPDISRVAGRISKLYLESLNWAESMGVVPTDFTVSWAPR